MDRTIVGKFGIEIVNPIGRDSFERLGERRTEHTAVSHTNMGIYCYSSRGPQNESFSPIIYQIERYYSDMIEELRQRENGLLKENEMFRSWLFGLSRWLPRMFGLSEDDNQESTDNSWKNPGIYAMPLDMSSEYLIQELDDLLENAKYQIDAYVSTLHHLQHRSTELQKLEEAQAKIQHLEHLVTEQTKVIEEYLEAEERKDIYK